MEIHMIRINQVKLPVGHTEEELYKKITSMLRISHEDIIELNIIRKSIDARKKPDNYYNYIVDIRVKNEKEILKKNKKIQMTIVEEKKYSFPEQGDSVLENRPVIIGMGPAGLFCGYYLAKHGYRPIIIEQGKDVDSRIEDVNHFWDTGLLCTSSNVQFGEGGAGTFSDGKLNTLVKDESGRNLEVLNTLVEHGAPEKIVYDAKPHIGTDVLCGIVKSMRQTIIQMGGSVFFQTKMTDVHIQGNFIKKISIQDCEQKEEMIDCQALVLAIGHSARATFQTLYERQIPMSAKSFAVGFRVEHPQSMINKSQYGMEESKELGAAAYKITAKTQSGRGVYSFCMCPGGYVVNASSENGYLAVNGMSYSKREGENANSAIIVSVTPEDFGSEHPLAGIEFQRKIEKNAYLAANGKIPVQYYGDYKKNVKKSSNGTSNENIQNTIQPNTIQPNTKGEFCFTDLSRILPQELNEAFVDGMEHFGKQIFGFNRADTILSGVESRTSSPVRIHRDDMFQSEIRGIYPAGEGAGYAGGITSAAMDGLKIAEMIAKQYRKFY